MLSYGYNGGKVSLPELPNIFPYLTVNLKKLSFIIDYIPMTDLKVKVDNQRDKKDMLEIKLLEIKISVSENLKYIDWIYNILKLQKKIMKAK